MSHYLAALFGTLLLLTAALGAWEGVRALDARRAVEAALLEGQAWLAADGGLSPRVHARVQRRLQEQGLDPARATVTGSPAGTPAGEPVWLKITYRHRFALPAAGLLAGDRGGWRAELEVSGRAEVPSARPS